MALLTTTKPNASEEETRKLREMGVKPRDRDEKPRGTEARGSLDAWLAKTDHGCEPEGHSDSHTVPAPETFSLF